MIKRRTGFALRFVRFALVIGSGVVLPGFVDNCNDLLVNLTRYVDPCGTFLANCAPGSFAVNAAEVGDYSVDCTCTVPGACNNGIPFDVITRICQ